MKRRMGPRCGFLCGVQEKSDSAATACPLRTASRSSSPGGEEPRAGGSAPYGGGQAAKPPGGGKWVSHGFSASRDLSLKVWKGLRSAGHRPEEIREYRFDEARSLRAVVVRKRGGAELCSNLAALKPPTGGLEQRSPVPDRERLTARLLLNRPPSNAVSVFRAQPAPDGWGLILSDRRRRFPLDRPPPPHRSLAMRPFPRRGGAIMRPPGNPAGNKDLAP